MASPPRRCGRILFLTDALQISQLHHERVLLGMGWQIVISVVRGCHLHEYSFVAMRFVSMTKHEISLLWTGGLTIPLRKSAERLLLPCAAAPKASTATPVTQCKLPVRQDLCSENCVPCAAHRSSHRRSLWHFATSHKDPQFLGSLLRLETVLECGQWGEPSNTYNI